MSSFDGTWRPDVQRPGADAPIEELELANGTYRCLSCDPPYEVAADGAPHAVPGQAGFDTLAIAVVDDRTVRRVASRAGQVVVDATTVLSPFGHTKRETQRQQTGTGAAFEFAIGSRRIGPAPAEAHLVSGRWQRVEADLPNHEEDTVFGIADGVLSMRDGFGRSFEAPLDGTPVPYVGDPRFDRVSAREIDERTIEETDWSGPEVVLRTRWQVDADGRTMHVRFEHADGRIQEQDGRKLD
ncbi:MAG TPA: hypothetical protein VF484_11050 [Candidatus Limnocylindrales bacterium]